MSYKFNINEHYCLNKDCPEYNKKGNGNLFIKEYKGKNNRALFMCRICKKCFCETHGTTFFRSKTPIEEIAKTLALIQNFKSIRAVARETNHKPDTILKWIKLAEGNKAELNRYFKDYMNYSQFQITMIWDLINKRKRKVNSKNSI